VLNLEEGAGGAALSGNTERVKEAAKDEGLATEWTDPWTGNTVKSGDVHNPQFAVDMGNWEQRLAQYRSALESVSEDELASKKGCVKIYRKVTAPLLDGIWYETLPGINLNAEEIKRINTGEGHPEIDVATTLDGEDHPPGHSNPKPPDVITPFTLGNQVLIYREHQDQRLREFWEDLEEGAMALWNAASGGAKGLLQGGRRLLDAFTDPAWLRGAGLVLLGIAGVTAAGVLLYRRTKDRPEQPALEKGDEMAANPDAIPEAHRAHLPVGCLADAGDVTKTRKTKGVVKIVEGHYADEDVFYYRGVEITRASDLNPGGSGRLVIRHEGRTHYPNDLAHARKVIDEALG